MMDIGSMGTGIKDVGTIMQDVTPLAAKHHNEITRLLCLKDRRNVCACLLDIKEII